MKFAVVMENGDGWHALVKSDHYDRCFAVFKLCELHLAKLYPKAEVKLSPYHEQNLRVGMHPDRELVLSRLLASEFPLPVAHDILEGSYTKS
jgi:hypothetical protein